MAQNASGPTATRRANAWRLAAAVHVRNSPRLLVALLHRMVISRDADVPLAWGVLVGAVMAVSRRVE